MVTPTNAKHHQGKIPRLSITGDKSLTPKPKGNDESQDLSRVKSKQA